MATNLALYRLLVKFGAEETEAETASTVDVSMLATKADLTAAIADLKTAIAESGKEQSRANVTAMTALLAIFSVIMTILRFWK